MTDLASNLAAFPGVPPRLFEMMKARGLTDRVLTVAGAEQVTPRMRRVSLTGPIDVVIHSDSTPGARWALHARPGEAVLTFGPRGRNVIHPGADWRLFVSDESGLPPIFAMLESLPAGAKAHAFIEVQSDEDRQALSTAADVELTWLSRGGAHAEASSPALIAAVAGFETPPGVGHAYLLGETSTIRKQRHELIARGLPKDQIFGEGYWRPGRVGGHDHLVEH